MSEKHHDISPADWGRIHAKAWLDETFRHKLETDPTAALHQFATEHGLKLGHLVTLTPRPAGVADEALRDILSGKTVDLTGPPACC